MAAVMAYYLKTPIYVMGSYALWQWLGEPEEWLPGDTDIFVDITQVPAENRNLVSGAISDVAALAGKMATPVDKGSMIPCKDPFVSVTRYGGTTYVQHAYGRRTWVPWYYVLGRDRANMNDPIQVSTQYMDADVILCKAGGQKILDDHFDLNVCAVGYRVRPYTPQDGLDAIFTIFLVFRRFGVDMCKDVRKLLFSLVMERLPDPLVVREWMYGQDFDPRAALKDPNTFAILRWERSSAPKGNVLMRGYHRAKKYMDRGYQVVEYPSRLAGQVDMIAALDWSRQASLKRRFKEDKRARKRAKYEKFKKEQYGSGGIR